MKIRRGYIFLSLMLFGCHQKADESAAIIKMLETESSSWRSGDFKTHANCWLIQPYSKILVSTTNGETYDIPPEVMTRPSTGMGGGGISVNTNYKMSIHEKDAWVSHDEESTSKDGKKTYSHEIRMLEKIDDQWKIVGQSIHMYKPK